MRPLNYMPPIVTLCRIDEPIINDANEKCVLVHPALGNSVPGDLIHLGGPLMPEGAEHWPKKCKWQVTGRKFGLPIDMHHAGCVLVLYVRPHPE
jgi:hypothetical protein